MTPKEKALELYNKMYDYSLFEEEAKRCALIAVDEIIEANPYKLSLEGKFNFWAEVKQEIEKL